MNFLLKIVEGPNKGAEIALVEGVDITLGKSDACDIVLADSTLGDEPMKIAVAADSVSLDGELLEQFHVATRGSTSFAVGPADSAWSSLVWPKAASADDEESAGSGDRGAGEPKPSGADSKRDEGDGRPARKRGCMGCLFWIVVILLAAAGACVYFREKTAPYANKAVSHGTSVFKRFFSPSAPVAAQDPVETRVTIQDIVKRHGLKVIDRHGHSVIVGNFETRAERLAATAEAYSAQPGVEIDFADSESLKSAVTDTLALVGERQMSVSAVTNRVAVLSGKVTNLRKALEAISADVPKIANVDVSGVSAQHGMLAESKDGSREELPVFGSVFGKAGAKRRNHLSLPVCGILTTPYPCLVMRDGRRVLEGAPVGDAVVLKIEADSVTLTNAAGRVVWKP